MKKLLKEYRTYPDNSFDASLLFLYHNNDIRMEFNYTLYYETRKASQIESTSIDLTESPLLNRQLECQNTGDIYNIECVVLEYYAGGWFMKLLIEHDGSHGVIFWENISSFAESIDNSVYKAHRDFKLI